MIGSKGYGPIFGELAGGYSPGFTGGLTGLSFSDGYIGPSISLNHSQCQLDISNEFNFEDCIIFSVNNKEAMRIEKDGIFCFGKKIAGPEQDFDPRFPLLRKLLQRFVQESPGALARG